MRHYYYDTVSDIFYSFKKPYSDPNFIEITEEEFNNCRLNPREEGNE